MQSSSSAESRILPAEIALQPSNLKLVSPLAPCVCTGIVCNCYTSNAPSAPSVLASIRNKPLITRRDVGDNWVAKVEKVRSNDNAEHVLIDYRAPPTKLQKGQPYRVFVDTNLNAKPLLHIEALIYRWNGEGQEPERVKGTTNYSMNNDGLVNIHAEFQDVMYGANAVFKDLNFTEIREISLNKPVDLDSLNLNIEVPPPPPDQPILHIYATTDKWGCNLGEMDAVVDYVGGFFPNAYPGTELVGSWLPNGKAPNPLNGVYQTLYSALPDLRSVLKGYGDTLLEQTNQLNKAEPSEITDIEFYAYIILYSTFKYFLAGLITNGRFNVKWLLRKYNQCFMQKLAVSKFKYYEQFFTDPQYKLVGLDKYFRDEIDRCLICPNDDEL